MNLAKKLAANLGAHFRRKRQVVVDLRESELRFRQVTEHIREVFFLVDPEMTRMFYVSPAYQDLWGRSCESLYANPRSFLDGIHADDRERASKAFAPHGTLVPFEVEYRVVHPNGTLRWIRARGFPIRNEKGETYRFTGFAADITERKIALNQITCQAQALEQSNRRLSLLGEMTGLLQTVVRVEEAADIIGGYLSQLHVGVGGALYLYKESRNYLDLLARWGELRLADRVVPDECWALRRGQSYRPAGMEHALHCRHTLQVDGPSYNLCLPMMVEGGALGLLHVVFADDSSATCDEDALFAQRMSEQLGLALANFRLRETLRLEAMHDPLTELYNRRFLEISLIREFARAAREHYSVAVMMLDLDHFKRFNDMHGHDVGDHALRQIGQVLIATCRAGDLACRFGGEEFAVVIPGATRETMVAWAERLRQSVREMRIVTDGRVLPPLTLSIGIAFFPESGVKTAEVIQAADQALYAAKHAGRDRYEFSEKQSGSAGGVVKENECGVEC